jgi:hypothetical protein
MLVLYFTYVNYKFLIVKIHVLKVQYIKSKKLAIHHINFT